MRPQLAQGDVAGAEHGAGVVLGLGQAALQQPQPRPHPELVRRAARGVALLADAQGLGDRLLGLVEAPLLDVVVAEVAHRRRRQVVEPVRAGRRRWRRAGRRARPGRPRAAARPRPRSTRCCAARRRRPARPRSARPGRPTVAPPRCRRPTRRGRCAGPGRSRAPARRRWPRGSRWRPGRAARRSRGRPRTTRSWRARCARRRPRPTSPIPRRSSSARSRDRDGVAEPVGEVQVDGHRLQQAGAGGGVVADVAQRGLVEGDGLPVRARAGGLGRRGGGVPQDPGDVAGRRRVVGEHARFRADRLERVDHRRVQRPLGTGHRRAEHRGPGDLVAERDSATVPVEQTGAGEHPDRRRRDAECGEQLGADGFGGARQQLEAPPGVRGQPGGPGQHGVPHALGQRRLRLGEDLADEERVARGAAVDVGRVEPVSVEERGDRGPAQRGQLQPARVG